MTTAAAPTVADTLRRAASRAALAPSVHNTQPWHFVVTSDCLEIRSEPRRRLTVLDPRGRQLLISCGCAVFHARVAIAAAGYESIVERRPDPTTPGLVARVWVGEPREWLPIAALDRAIDDRRTNRRAFLGEAVPTDVIHDLVAAARAEGGHLLPIIEPQLRNAVAELSRLADRVQEADSAYQAELQRWTTDDPRRRDGVQAASVPYAGPFANPDDTLPIRAFDVRGMGWLPASSESDSDQCLLLLSAGKDEPDSWLRTGEALERVWLTLTQLGYSASPLTQVVEVPQTNGQLREALHIDLHPQILLRVGHAPNTVPTPRLDAADVITVRMTGRPS
jgi:Nitroreductase family